MNSLVCCYSAKQSHYKQVRKTGHTERENFQAMIFFFCLPIGKRTDCESLWVFLLLIRASLNRGKCSQHTVSLGSEILCSILVFSGTPEPRSLNRSARHRDVSPGLNESQYIWCWWLGAITLTQEERINEQKKHIQLWLRLVLRTKDHHFLVD